MDSRAFIQRLGHLDGDDIAAIATSLRDGLESVDGELAWWRATIAVTGSLRRLHRTRQASMAAHQAVSAVLGSARAAGVEDQLRDEVTTVARAAAEAARLLVAGDDDTNDVTGPLMQPWSRLDAA